MKQNNLKTRSMVLCALFAALTAVCSQIQIALPMVPINLALFAVHIAGALLGAKYGSISLIVYTVLGAVGVPVFAGFTGGLGILFGKTGGYIIGYILAAFLVGFLSKKWGFSFAKLCLSMTVGLLACYLFGTLWFMLVVGSGLITTLGWCVFPFLPGDVIKILLAALVTVKLRKAFVQNGWIND
ncbi:MAG: biotin transporter BioY [Oscillospiraceae bacterium]|nr:biotin transporter BioY [Oscillospiraceae bacterium]